MSLNDVNGRLGRDDFVDMKDSHRGNFELERIFYSVQESCLQRNVYREKAVKMFLFP